MEKTAWIIDVARAGVALNSRYIQRNTDECFCVGRDARESFGVGRLAAALQYQVSAMTGSLLSTNT